MGFKEEYGVGLGLCFKEEHDVGVGLDLGFELCFLLLFYFHFFLLAFHFLFNFTVDGLHLVQNYFCFCLNYFSIAEYLNGYLFFFFFLSLSLLSSYVDLPLLGQVDFINGGPPCQVCADLASFPLTVHE